MEEPRSLPAHPMDAATQIIGHEKLILSRMLSTAHDAEDEGDCIGPYCLIECIGEGGFGMVWRAEQTEPVQRQVALKIIKRGMDTGQVLARFDHERQALASMDHPGIAAMLDAGASADGRPYFAMELVQGEPITEWCFAHDAPLAERLRLFTQVCQAVHHAHQKGIIHRDLKPSNVLVTEASGTAAPKVIDFGIAKAIRGATLMVQATLTQADQVIGTPAYMSPEQIDGTRVLDTRSDIYALGVLLYELLTGSPPFARSTSIDALKQSIREQTPTRPSQLTRQMRKSQEKGRTLQLTGTAVDLDWITMRALEKAPERRYASALDLAEDVQRFMDDEPVHARPPSWSYVSSRWIKRHRPVFVAACTVLMSMIVGTGLALWQAKVARAAQHLAEVKEARAREAESKAVQARKQSEQTSTFVTGLLDRVTGEVHNGRNPEALKAALTQSGDDIRKLDASPDLRMALLERIAGIYDSIGETKLALPVRKQLMDEVVKLHGPDSSKSQEAEFDYIKEVIDHGDRATGPPMLEDLLQRVEAQGRRGDKFWFDVQRRLVSAWVKLRNAESALAAAEIEMAEANARKLPSKAMVVHQLSYATALDLAGRFEQAETLLDELRTIALKENNTRKLDDIEQALLHVFWRSDNNKRAAALLREQLPAHQARLGTDTKDIVPKLLELSTYEAHAEENDSAIAHATQALTIIRQLISKKAGADGKGDTSSLRGDLFDSLNQLASAEDNGHHYEEAIAHREEALAIARLEGNDKHIDSALDGLAFSHRKAGRLDDAYALYEQMLRDQRDKHANFKDLLESYSNLIAIRTDQRRHDEAIVLAQQMWKLLNQETSTSEDRDYFGHVANQAWNAFKNYLKDKADAPEPPELGDWQAAARNAKVKSTRAQKDGAKKKP